jgi:type VI secretion system secreted protein VgrG
MKRVTTICLVAGFAMAVLLYGSSAVLASPQLGSAQGFAVLGASTVTNTGSTTIYGNVGLYPGPSVSGFATTNTVVNGPGSTGLINGPGLVTGTIYISDAVAQQAQVDALNAYTTLAGLSGTDLTGQNLGGGRTITPGVYTMTDSTAYLNGVLNLDAGGLPNARVVFNLAAALTTGSNAVVNVTGGDTSTEIYWVVGSSATLGTSTMFAGNILANTSITLTTGADILCGRAIALTGGVTLDTDRISNNNSLQDFGTGRSDFGSYGFSGGAPTVVPVPGAFVLVAIGTMSLSVFRKRALILN